MSTYVTGADGFIGSQLMKILPDGIKVSKDLRELIPEDFKGVTGVVHLAAHGVAAKNRNWKDCLEVNVLGTENLLHCLQGYNVPIVIARSFMEDSEVWDDPYFSSKRIATDLARKRDNIRFVRIFHVYGPKMEGVLKYAKECLLAGATATFGSGLGKRDWIHVSDVAWALLASLHAPVGDYDAGTGQLTSIREVVEIMKDVSGSQSELIFDPSRDRNDVDVLLKAENFPPRWSPQVSLTRGLAELIP